MAKNSLEIRCESCTAAMASVMAGATSGFCSGAGSLVVVVDWGVSLGRGVGVVVGVFLHAEAESARARIMESARV